LNPLTIRFYRRDSFCRLAFLTFVVRKGAHRYGFVAKPKADRWHQRPTAMMGGVAIFFSTISRFPAFSSAFRTVLDQTLIILAASSFLFAVGLIDDILHIKPYQKLIGQIIASPPLSSAAD
jgi:UDP-GlcNAc:undecaprenyl-phosphate GlcNAc-1-phosphate transferase